MIPPIDEKALTQAFSTPNDPELIYEEEDVEQHDGSGDHSHHNHDASTL